ncbi:MAG: Stealth CR1 domain-containing protein [Clostridia bacterium]|nr:Stealth CR1 domain-containing protein [Clostridia bacterium]
MAKKSKKNFDPSKPIDFVIIWVDGNDPEWRAEKNKYDPNFNEENFSNSEVRFRDWDNLQYWFRGVEQYAPWVNKIHFVTWGHLPPWLDTTNPKLNIVKHTDYIPAEYLPTFSSHTIELNLHRIEGLAEQFVYFNDDMFLNKPVKPEDFFKNGLPCETSALDCIYFGKDSAGYFCGADITIINTHFKKKQVVKRDWKKWLSFKNGKGNVLKTVMLYYWPWFPGIFYQHVASSYLKSTFETVWEKEFDALNETCMHKFRQIGDVNQWVMLYWQLAEGKFNVRPRKFGQCYHVKKSSYNSMLNDIKEQKHSMICINDTAKTEDFEDKKAEVIRYMDAKLPQKSSFEK